MLRKPIILIDNGHGNNTPGKRSPDGRLREYSYNRTIAARVVDALKQQGETAFLLVKEDEDISLKERVERVNAYCRQYGKSNVIVVSIHVNAAKCGAEWLNARGWSVYTSPGQTASDKIADYLHGAAVEILKNGEYGKGTFGKNQRPVREDNSDGDVDFEDRLYILTKTPCPAVLTENLFQDNRDDVDFLLSEQGKQAITDIHVKGLSEYLKNARK